jgi:hypothetical protein
MSNGSAQRLDDSITPVAREDDKVRPPSRRQVHAALAHYAGIPRARACDDQGDVAAAVREDMHDLEAARAAATERLLGEE